LHGTGRHEQCYDVGNSDDWDDDTRARRNVGRKSKQCPERQRGNSELECQQCNHVHGVGWLERHEGDKRQHLDRGAYSDDELRAELHRSGRRGLSRDDSDGDDGGAGRDAHGQPNDHRDGHGGHADLEFYQGHLVHCLRRLERCESDERQRFDRKPYRNDELYIDLHWSRRQHGCKRARDCHNFKCRRDHSAIQRAHSVSEAAIRGHCPGQCSGQVGG